jgi:hypothetical protein
MFLNLLLTRPLRNDQSVNCFVFFYCRVHRGVRANRSVSSKPIRRLIRSSGNGKNAIFRFAGRIASGKGSISRMRRCRFVNRLGKIPAFIEA